MIVSAYMAAIGGTADIDEMTKLTNALEKVGL
jgi:hypothetical protein